MSDHKLVISNIKCNIYMYIYIYIIYDRQIITNGYEKLHIHKNSLQDHLANEQRHIWQSNKTDQ